MLADVGGLGVTGGKDNMGRWTGYSLVSVASNRAVQGLLAAGAFGSQSVDAAVLALLDTLLTSLYALASVFGEGLTKVGG